MKEILRKCKRPDLMVFLGIAGLGKDDEARDVMLDEAEKDEASKADLIANIEREIRYYASSDIAYLWRKIFQDDKEDPGVSASEMVRDVCKKSKVKVKLGASVESMLENLANAVVEKELAQKSPEELKKFFEEGGIDDKEQNIILGHIRKKGKAVVLPIIYRALGPQKTFQLIEIIVISVVGQIFGREAIKILFREILKRNPWVSAALGPIMWVTSAGWLAFDLQGPAYRKTVPFCLYLAVVSLRDKKMKV